MKSVRFCSVATAVLLLTVIVPASQADIVSGPGEGSEIKSLKVFVAAGDSAGKEVDFVAERKDKPTVYALVPADKFSRPMARFLKTLDDKLKADRADVDVVAVWLSDEQAAAKDRLPRIQQSLKMERTWWCVYPGEKAGPNEWGINSDADITVVVADGTKVKASLGYRSINDTEVPKVIEKLPPKK